MNYVALTERLVKSLVVDEDMVTVKEFPSDDENKITIEVLVSARINGVWSEDINIESF